MPLPGLILLCLVLLAVCSFFPGFFFVRRLRWTPLEKLCASVGLSLALLYLGAFAIYSFGPKDPRPVYWSMAAASAVLGALAWRDAARLFRTFRIRQTLAAMAVLLAWTAALLATIRVYSGGAWVADWYEHFQRSLFFLDRLPRYTILIDLYALPARPPMQNLLGAFFLGLTGERYELFQVIFAWLNCLVLFSCALLLPALGFGKRRRLIPLVGLLAASPVVMENITYTWTKSLTVFYVVTGLALYLAALRKRDPVRTSAAFLALAAGALVHYSAGPYLLFLGGHYLLDFFRRPSRPWREAALAILPAALLMATWFGWSIHTYGLKTTVASNTAVTGGAYAGSSNVEKIGANLFDTIVPAWMRGDSPSWRQANPDGVLRDQAFAFYQLNLVFGMGVLGGPLVLWLLYRRLLKGSAPQRRFWAALIPVCVVLGVAVVGERDPMGVPHLALLAIEVMGLTMLAAAFSSSGRALRIQLVAGCCIDGALGVLLQARIQGLENTSREQVFAEFTYLGAGQFGLTQPGPQALSDIAWKNWLFKHRLELFERWLRDLPRGHENDPAFQAGWAEFQKNAQEAAENDATNWGGWGARHGGSFRYLGDHIAGAGGSGTDIASGVVVLLFLAGMGLLARDAMGSPAKTAVPVPSRKESVRRAKR